MAQAATLTINKKLSDVGERTITLRGTMALSGTYDAGGPTLDLTLFAGYPVRKDGTAIVRFWGIGASDHTYGYDPGADLTAGKVLATVTSTGVELANGAMPAAITSDVINFEIILPKFG